MRVIIAWPFRRLARVKVATIASARTGDVVVKFNARVVVYVHPFLSWKNVVRAIGPQVQGSSLALAEQGAKSKLGRLKDDRHFNLLSGRSGADIKFEPRPVRGQE